MLFCCSSYFKPEIKLLLPSKDKLYRCFEFGHCPKCNSAVSRTIEQSLNFVIHVKQKTRFRALKELKQAQKEHIAFIKNTRFGTKTNENFYYGDFKKTNKKDYKGNRIYKALRRNFNGKSEYLEEVKTYYAKGQAEKI